MNWVNYFSTSSALFIQLKQTSSKDWKNNSATETSISIENDVATIFAHVKYIVQYSVVVVVIVDDDDAPENKTPALLCFKMILKQIATK